MTTGFSNALRVEELKKRLLFTAGMLAIYRVGVAIPTPGIDGKAMQAFFQEAASNVFGLVNLFSGGALERFSILAEIAVEIDRPHVSSSPRVSGSVNIRSPPST